MKKAILALILATALAAPGLAQAEMNMKDYKSANPHAGMGRMGAGECCVGCGSRGSGMGMGMGRMDKMEDMVNMCLAHAGMMGFDNEQMARVKPVHREMKRKQIQYKSELKLAEMDLAETLEVKDFDLNKASAAVKTIADIKARYHLEMLKHMKDIRSIMTDSQFKGTAADESDEDEEE